jgi:dipeptidase E
MTGGGDSRHFLEIDKQFIKLLSKSATLLFIPLAGDKRSWKNSLARIVQTFSTISFKKIESCSNLHDLTWDYLKNFDAIYIDGGNTFQLMDFIRDTHAFELLHRFIHQGGIINGDSAGAIVLGSHIETAHFGLNGDQNKAGVISYQGLNLLGNWAIHCHYKKSENKEIKNFVKDFGFPVLALHDESSVYIKERRLKVIGKKSVTVFTDKEIKVIKSGTSFYL